MKFRSVAAVFAAATLMLGAAACGKSGPPEPAGSGGPSAGAASDACQSAGVTYQKATNVALTGSPTYDRIKSSGTARIGVKADQPNLRSCRSSWTTSRPPAWR